MHVFRFRSMHLSSPDDSYLSCNRMALARNVFSFNASGSFFSIALPFFIFILSHLKSIETMRMWRAESYSPFFTHRQAWIFYFILNVHWRLMYFSCNIFGTFLGMANSHWQTVCVSSETWDKKYNILWTENGWNYNKNDFSMFKRWKEWNV